MSPAQLHPGVEARSPRGRAGVVVFPLLWVDALKVLRRGTQYGVVEKNS